jgi:triacylglycerol lipase
MAYDKNIAVELGTLIDAAYSQFNGVNNWRPQGYEIACIFNAVEPWKHGPQSIQTPNAPFQFVLPSFQIPAGFPQFSIPQLPIPTPALPTAVPFGYVATKDGNAYVIIRGTQTPLEWLADFTVGQVPFQQDPTWGRTTVGFKNIYDQFATAIIDQLKLLRAKGQAKNIFVTGHSLGAALAHLVAADIFIQLGVAPISYTFSGPRTGDPLFAAAYAKAQIETWRVFNTEDIVPTVPLAAVELTPSKIGLTTNSQIEIVLQYLVKLIPSGVFQHIGNPVAVTFQRGDIADNHNLTNTYNALP